MESDCWSKGVLLFFTIRLDDKVYSRISTRTAHAHLPHWQACAFTELSPLLAEMWKANRRGESHKVRLLSLLGLAAAEQSVLDGNWGQLGN